jgi:hypothetical protein
MVPDAAPCVIMPPVLFTVELKVKALVLVLVIVPVLVVAPVTEKIPLVTAKVTPELLSVPPDSQSGG